jgi:hypothetical protein
MVEANKVDQSSMANPAEHVPGEENAVIVNKVGVAKTASHHCGKQFTLRKLIYSDW